MGKKKQSKGRVEMGLFAIVITLLSLSFMSGAGFGSSYLPKVDGELQLAVPIGSNVSYFIYPQNMENKTLLVKINITDENNLLVNQLQDYYEVPAQTSSDSIKIELVFHLDNNTELIEKKYPIKFEVLSTYKTEDVTNIVSFSPLGFSKSFFVVGKPAQSSQTIPPIVEPVYVPSTSGGGGGSKSKDEPNIPPPKRPDTINPEPTNPIIPEPVANEQDNEGLLGTEITEPEKSQGGNNTLIIIIIIGLLVIAGITIIVKKYGDM